MILHKLLKWSMKKSPKTIWVGCIGGREVCWNWTLHADQGNCKAMQLYLYIYIHIHIHLYIISYWLIFKHILIVTPLQNLFNSFCWRDVFLWKQTSMWGMREESLDGRKRGWKNLTLQRYQEALKLLLNLYPCLHNPFPYAQYPR